MITALGANNLPALPDDLFLDLAQLIYDECGLRFDHTNRFLLHKRLAARVATLGVNGFREYYYYLKFDPSRASEFDALHSHLTTNETYFMREKGQLHAFAAFASSLPAAGRRRLRIWSAGCASGEEPYSIAILLTEAGMTPKDFEILGSDISTRVLARAREAAYTMHSFRFLDEEFRRRYFTPSGSQYVLNEAFRSLVSFSVINLYHDDKLNLLGQFDAVFCRNVLIYFDNDSKLAVINNLHRRLCENGFLFLGHSESLITLPTPFKMGRISGEFVYTK